MRELYRSVVTTRELSNKPKFSVFKSVFVLTFTYGHEAWVMTEGRDGIFAEFHGVTLRVRVRCC